MAVGYAYVFPGFLTPVLTQLFFPKPPTTFLTCFCRSERRKYAGKKSRLNRGSNSQLPGHESDTLTTEPPRRGQTARKSQDDMDRYFLHLYYIAVKKCCNLSVCAEIFPHHCEYFPHAENLELLFCSTAFDDKIIKGNIEI